MFDWNDLEWTKPNQTRQYSQFPNVVLEIEITKLFSNDKFCSNDTGNSFPEKKDNALA